MHVAIQLPPEWLRQNAIKLMDPESIIHYQTLPDHVLIHDANYYDGGSEPARLVFRDSELKNVQNTDISKWYAVRRDVFLRDHPDWEPLIGQAEKDSSESRVKSYWQESRGYEEVHLQIVYGSDYDLSPVTDDMWARDRPPTRERYVLILNEDNLSKRVKAERELDRINLGLIGRLIHSALKRRPAKPNRHDFAVPVQWIHNAQMVIYIEGRWTMLLKNRYGLDVEEKDFDLDAHLSGPDDRIFTVPRRWRAE